VFDNKKKFLCFLINYIEELWFWLSDFGVVVALGSVGVRHYNNYFINSYQDHQKISLLYVDSPN